MQQMSFIAYYFHWQQSELLMLTKPARRRYCDEISRINKLANGETKNIFDI